MNHSKVNHSRDLRAASSRELAQLEYLLLGDLRHLLSEPVTSQTQQRVATVLDLMFTMLPSRFELEESGSALSAVTRRFPNWHDQAMALRLEHAHLFEELRDLRQAVENEEGYGRLSEEVLAKIGVWIERFQTHEREERRLLLLVTGPVAAQSDY